MTTNNKGRAGWHQATPKTSDSRDDTELSQELSHTVKSEVDLQSWAALGGNVKPSRTDHRQKRAWKRGGK